MRAVTTPKGIYALSMVKQIYDKSDSKSFDCEMMYVECKRCGKPVIWEPGKTTALLHESGIKSEIIDEYCLILSEGCSSCLPEKKHYSLAMVRLTETEEQDILSFDKKYINA